MQLPRLVVAASLAAALVLRVDVVSGQNYPSKSIRIVTTEVGGGNDFTARLIASGISGPLGQPVITDNRNPTIAQETVAKATPDGYTLLVHGTTFITAPLLEKRSYDPVRDFLPISLLGAQPHILVVHPSVPVKSVKELIALAKARPGELNYGSASTGSTAHLAAELFKAMADVNIVRIPYKGTGQALNDLVGGQVQLVFATMSSVTAHLKSGRLNALAVTSLEPTALAPGLPTMAATVPEFEWVSVTLIVAPAKTPAAVIARLNQEVVRLLNQPDVKQKFLSVGAEALGSTPEKLGATVKSGVTRLSKLIKDAGISRE